MKKYNVIIITIKIKKMEYFKVVESWDRLYDKRKKY